MNTMHIKPTETVEAFKQKEPDWKRLYYSLALRVVTAQCTLEAGNNAAAREALDKATSLIATHEKAMEMTQNLVIVKTLGNTDVA